MHVLLATAAAEQQSSSIFNTLRRKATKKMKETEAKGDGAKELLYKEELLDIQSNVTERWRKLRGFAPEQAVVS